MRIPPRARYRDARDAGAGGGNSRHRRQEVVVVVGEIALGLGVDCRGRVEHHVDRVELFDDGDALKLTGVAAEMTAGLPGLDALGTGHARRQHVHVVVVVKPQHESTAVQGNQGKQQIRVKLGGLGLGHLHAKAHDQRNRREEGYQATAHFAFLATENQQAEGPADEDEDAQIPAAGQEILALTTDVWRPVGDRELVGGSQLAHLVGVGAGDDFIVLEAVAQDDNRIQPLKENQPLDVGGTQAQSALEISRVHHVAGVG